MAADLHVTPRALEGLAAKFLVAAEGVIKALKDAAALSGAPVKLVGHFISTAVPRAAASAMNSPSPLPSASLQVFPCSNGEGTGMVRIDGYQISTGKK